MYRGVRVSGFGTAMGADGNPVMIMHTCVTPQEVAEEGALMRRGRRSYQRHSLRTTTNADLRMKNGAMHQDAVSSGANAAVFR
jgi:hypothetical protein